MQRADYPALTTLEADGFGHWLAGFVDGEGGFLIRRLRQNTRWPGFACEFVIALRDDDREILETITTRTGIGQIWTAAARRSVAGGPQRATARWTVGRKSECLRLVEILDRFPLRAKKQRDFMIWRDAVTLWSEVKHRGCRDRLAPHDWTAIADLKRQLEDGRRYQ